MCLFIAPNQQSCQSVRLSNETFTGITISQCLIEEETFSTRSSTDRKR
jgi:hypothetical protein